MTGNIKVRVLDVKNAIESLSAQIDGLNNLLKDNKALSSGVQDALTGLNTKKEQLKQAINHFKIN